MSFFDSIFSGSTSKDTPQNQLHWNELTDLKQLEELEAESRNLPVIIFKHSTRCGISRMALKNWEREYDLPKEEASLYLLDLLNHREISNAIAEKFRVYHESPQLLLIRDGNVVHHSSHGDISAQAVARKITS